MRVPPSLWFLILSGLVAVLFHLKYEVQALEKRLAGLNQAIDKDRNAIQLLEAEWTYLNRPERLARLAKRYLPLKPPSPHAMRTMADVPGRFDSPHRVESAAKAEISQ